MKSIRVGEARLEVVQGDITAESTDAVVNAANSGLLGGGGVDGAIHRAGGPAILEECKRIRAERGRLPAGQAVITTAGRMKARHVIHTVGPVYGGSKDDPVVLASCYRGSLAKAALHKLESVAFPSISTGAYGYPVDEAAPVALRAVKAFLEGESTVRLVRFVLFDQQTLAAYEQALASLGRAGDRRPAGGDDG
jgi:O-acetyl-ADP-ribose deacetylase (regulator of RNase III)